MTVWTYNNHEVQVLPGADIPNALQRGAKYDWMVQRVLQTVRPWKDGENPHQTARVGPRLWQHVIPNHDQIPMWGIHRGHRTDYVDLSPFLDLREVGKKDAPRTYALTIELTGTPDDPIITRVYPGNYHPPLPWQITANGENSTMKASLAFWRQHSYAYRGTLVIGELKSTPPEWFAS